MVVDLIGVGPTGLDFLITFEGAKHVIAVVVDLSSEEQVVAVLRYFQVVDIKVVVGELDWF